MYMLQARLHCMGKAHSHRYRAMYTLPMQPCHPAMYNPSLMYLLRAL